MLYSFHFSFTNFDLSIRLLYHKQMIISTRNWKAAQIILEKATLRIRFIIIFSWLFRLAQASRETSWVLFSQFSKLPTFDIFVYIFVCFEKFYRIAITSLRKYCSKSMSPLTARYNFVIIICIYTVFSDSFVELIQPKII